MIDTHCHLTYPDFDADLDAVLQRAGEAGVTDFITVGTGPEDWQRALALAERCSRVRVALGLHPNEASIFAPGIMEELRRLAADNPRVVAIGETGLDWHHKDCAPETQRESFRAHLRLAAELQKPFVMHCRNAEEDVFAELDAFQARNNACGTGSQQLTEAARGTRLRGVWHCFTSTAAFAARAAEMGLYFSVGGAITYPKNDALRAVVAGLPADRLMLETDCPFLPPQGWRGKRNEPAYLTKVVAVLAEIRRTTPEEIDRSTTENARRLFGIG